MGVLSRELLDSTGNLSLNGRQIAASIKMARDRQKTYRFMVPAGNRNEMVNAFNKLNAELAGDGIVINVTDHIVFVNIE